MASQLHQPKSRQRNASLVSILESCFDCFLLARYARMPVSGTTNAREISRLKRDIARLKLASFSLCDLGPQVNEALNGP